MRHFLIISILLSLSLRLKSQDNDVAKNVIYGEVAGSGIFISANYERHFYLNDKLFLAPKIGVGWILVGSSLPHAITANYGGNHKLEFGAGGTYVSGTFFDDFDGYLPHAILGYRYQKSEVFLFRFTLSPFIYEDDVYNNVTMKYDNKLRTFFYAGISFGTSF